MSSWTGKSRIAVRAADADGPTRRSGAGRYYVDDVGVWAGAAASRLGLTGRVEPAALGRLLAGRHPATGVRLEAPRPHRRAGWDLIFTAPKSLSLLAAAASPAGGRAVAEAHHRAVADVLAWLETHACYARRQGALVAGTGTVAAGFEHRSSSAGDPHLHSHVLVANLVEAGDGRWSALDGSSLWLQRRALSSGYHLGLRHHLLAAGLDFDWRLGRDGAADVAAVDPGVIRTASTRRGELLAALDGRDEPTPTATSTLRSTLRRDAPAGGTAGVPDNGAGTVPSGGDGVAMSRADADRLVADAARAADARRGAAPPHGDDDLVAPVVAILAGRRSTYGVAEVMAALAAHHAEGASVTSAHRWALAFTGASLRAPDGRWTSPLAADADARLADRAVRRRRASAGLVPGSPVPAGDATALERLAYGGEGVAVIHGRPGPADTDTPVWIGQAALLDRAVQAWRGAGHEVVLDTTSPAARRRWDALTGLSEPARPYRTPTVVVVDRADRRPTAELAALVAGAEEAGAKLVLVEGGTLPARRRAVSEGLEALADRLGRIAGGIGAGDDRRWVPLLAAWTAAGGPRPLLVALGPAECDEANRRARAVLVAEGRVGGPSTRLGGRTYAAGDRVLSLGRGGPPAGTTGTVTGVPGPRRLRVRWDGAGTDTLGPFDARRFGPAYATTPPMLRLSTTPVLLLGYRADLGRHAGRVLADSRELTDGPDRARAAGPGTTTAQHPDRAVGQHRGHTGRSR